ncbi:MAG: hypothetical protein AAGH82_09580 [Pseudomonadota bacterium]
MAGHAFRLKPGARVDMEALIRWLENNGFLRVSTVRDTGEYAVRGGILDLYPPALDAPVRLDFFGDNLETVRSFDAGTQRTLAQLKRVDLVPMSEIVLTPEAIARFRRNYVSSFGAARPEDTLYQAVSEGRRHPGMEHWLPLFHDELEPLSAYFGDAPLVFDHLATDAIGERFDQAVDHFEARQTTLEAEKNTKSAPYLPVEPTNLYLSREQVAAFLSGPTAATPKGARDRVAGSSIRPGPIVRSTVPQSRSKTGSEPVRICAGRLRLRSSSASAFGRSSVDAMREAVASAARALAMNCSTAATPDSLACEGVGAPWCPAASSR